MRGIPSVHLLRFIGEVIAPVRLGAHKGSALRGALFGSLWRQFCLNPAARTCQECPHLQSCPVAFLLATTDPGEQRGQDLPRPYVIEPPPGGPAVWQEGQLFEFRLVTFGRALDLLPYILLGIEDAGDSGFGARIRRDLQWWDRRPGGRFALREAWAVDPIAGRQEQVFFSASREVRPPRLPVGWDDLSEAARRWSDPEAIRIRLLTPMRLIDGGHLVHPGQLRFRVLVDRLLDRIDALGRFAADDDPTLDPGPLRAKAEAIRVEENTRWADVFRYSARHSRGVPIGGLVGDVTLRGELAPYLPLLLWGQLAHVGKDAVLGNGAFSLEVI